jgi:predicted ATPase/HPt (histidine-containing phosphotransfer) domain-containing protein
MGLEGYAIGEIIAESAYSVVRRATRRVDGERVILKLNAREVPSAREIGQLEFEHRILRKLSNPAVIRALALESQGDRLALVLEDYGGVDLSERLGKAPLDVFFTVAAGVARALQVVHRAGVIHKDVNPRNVLLNATTGVVKLIDFGISTELSQERQGIETGSHLEGTLPYVSPEQTGRMNRDLDYRSDYYSLGVTLFELLTGSTPFSASDVMGWVHCHISHPAPDPRSLVASVPEAVARIVLKLLAKNPEDRYQGSHGLLADLEIGRREWSERGAITPFALGTADVPERFHVSQKLIGREQEVATLHAAFDQASRGPARMLLIGGYSGVGKSALVHELQKDVVRGRGHFIAGKFDQLDRNVPYGAIVQALRTLVKQLLGEPEARLAVWRRDLRTAVGSNGRVLTELVPELEEILGPQPPVPEVAPREAHTRFQRVFGDFLRAAAVPHHPLVLFVDDLQWADPSTPELLVQLLSDDALRHVLVIGSYRDNEVQSGHVLRAAVSELRNNRPEVLQEILLSPLSEDDVNRIVADTLHRDPGSCLSVSALIAQKTGGNPFFVKELLAALGRDGAFRFVPEHGRWDWDEELVGKAAVSDNVVDLMVQRLRRLPPATVEVLRLAACLGNSFELDSLARVAARPAGEAAAALWEAVRERVLMPMGSAYRLVHDQRAYDDAGLTALGVRYQFQHDRVQQAAYSLVHPDERARVHLAIGRLLLGGGQSQTDQDLFETVNHLNLGRSLIDDPAERRTLSRLNESAGARAKRAAAYAVAAGYFDTAVDLLGREEAAADADRVFECRRSRVECIFLCGEPERAEALCNELVEVAHDRWSTIAAIELKAQVLDHQARLLEAIATLRGGLRLMGVELPEDMGAIGALIGEGIGKMQAHLARVPIENLVDLPAMTDREKITIAKLLFHLVVPSIQACPPLFILSELMMFDLALTAGLNDFSCKNFVDCGIIQGGILGDHDRAYRLGKVAFELLKREASRPLAAGVSFVFAAFVSHWRAHYRESVQSFDDAVRLGLELGDNPHVTYAYAIKAQRLFFASRPLAECDEQAQLAAAYLTEFRAANQLDGLRLVQRTIARLRGEAVTPSDREFTERLAAIGNAQWIFLHAHAQCLLSIIERDYEAAARWHAVAEENEAGGRIQYAFPDHHALGTLLLVHRWSAAGTEERAELSAKMDEALARLQGWARSCPANYAAKHKLAAAEVARVRGEPLEQVLALYDEALSLAGDDFLAWRALTSELQGEHWAARGQPRIARVFLTQAYRLYERWGAAAKVRQMREQHPGAFDATAPAAAAHGNGKTTTTHGTGALDAGALDLESMIKASQAISSEVKPERLFARLMATILENAGAQRGCLVLPDEATGELYVEASASVQDGAAGPQRRVVVHRCAELTPEIVRYVARTGKTVVVDDALHHDSYREDAHVVRDAVKSVLCLPVVQQSKLVAILYAENNAATHAFTPQRLRLLQVIASQAAISITNARAYDSLEDRVAERTRELAEKNREVAAMLDSMQQGLFTIDEALAVQPQYSPHLEAIVGTRDIAGRDFSALLFRDSSVAPDALQAMRAAIQFSFHVPRFLAEVNAAHLIRQFQRTGPGGERRHYEADWTYVADEQGIVSKILVAVRDVTVLKKLTESVAEKARELDVVGQILDAGLDAFDRFVAGADAMLDESRSALRAFASFGQAESELLMRNLHTVKGNARMLGLSYIVEAAHRAEQTCQQRPIADNGMRTGVLAAVDDVGAALEAYRAVHASKLAQLRGQGDARQSAELEAIAGAVSAVNGGSLSPAEAIRSVGRVLARMQTTPLQDIVRDTARMLPSLAGELEKTAPVVECVEPGLRLHTDWAHALRGALVHALRNALDHGIEPPLEREGKGKPQAGRIRVRASRHERGAEIAVSDDGRGLDMTALRTKLGDFASDDGALAEKVFLSGTTTAASVSATSGRGVGMDAVRSFVRRLGGEARVVLTGPADAGRRSFELVFDLPNAALENARDAGPSVPPPRPSSRAHA